jgi:hypothetical protein
MRKCLFKLPEHLIALTSIHVVIGQMILILDGTFLFLLSPYGRTKVIETTLVLLHGHVAAASVAERLRVAYKVSFCLKDLLGSLVHAIENSWKASWMLDSFALSLSVLSRRPPLPFCSKSFLPLLKAELA